MISSLPTECSTHRFRSCPPPPQLHWLHSSLHETNKQTTKRRGGGMIDGEIKKGLRNKNTWTLKDIWKLNICLNYPGMSGTMMCRSGPLEYTLQLLCGFINTTAGHLASCYQSQRRGEGGGALGGGFIDWWEIKRGPLFLWYHKEPLFPSFSL